jgi:hypothetical protein
MLRLYGCFILSMFRGVLATIAVLTACLLMSACGGDGGTAAAANAPQLDPSNFGATATSRNAWFPLRPGTQTVRVGKVNRGHRRLQHRVVTTVTDVFKSIRGIPAVGVLDQDIDAGQVGEQSVDFLAVDKSGAVWNLGSYTEAYEGGRFVSANDGWLAGTGGAKAGIWMLAKPRAGAPAYVQEDRPGSDPTVAKVVRTGVRTCVPYKCFTNTLVIDEDGSENKYFARGVGAIKTQPKGTGEAETEELINVRRLGPRGLSELSAEVLKLDRHARQTVSRVYGHSKAAARRRG